MDKRSDILGMKAGIGLRLGAFLALILFVSGSLLNAAGGEPRRHRRSNHNTCRRILRHALGHHAAWRLYEFDGKRFVMIEKEGERFVALLTADYSQAEGYRGITNSLVMFDLQGVVREVMVVESEDTPPYVKRVVRKGFLEQFKDLKPGTEPEVDAVTGATMTCEAITQSVTETMEIFASLAEKLDFTGPEPRAKSEGTTVTPV